MMSIQTDITRGVLGVPGCAFAFLLQRSSEFTPFVSMLRRSYPDVVEFVAIFSVMQQGFNRLEPLHFIDRITENPFPDTPSHRVMLHLAKEDAQVATVISYLMGRTVGAKLMVPAIRPVWGLEEVSYPYEGNSLIEYDFGVPDNPKPTYPAAKETDTHGLLRKLPIGQDQVWHFLETGETISVCDGPCDPQ